MENTIAERIGDFLKTHPPFSLLERELLAAIARKVVVQYRQPNEIIFRQGEMPGKFIYVVREGAVQLLREEEQGPVLIEQCDEGDVFGIRPLVAKDSYAMTAKVVEESLIYAVNIEGFEKALLENPKVAFYLAGNFAALEKDRWIEADASLLEIQTIDRSKEPVVCRPNTPVKEAALTMSAEEVGSIIVVDEQKRPIGIITDKDLRRQVATGHIDIDAPVSVIMSSPVVSIRPDATVADVQIEMVRRRVHHLCLTQDGTDQSPVIGVISEHDLLVIQGNNPAILIREIARARSAVGLRRIREKAESLLRKYLYQEVSIAYISTVMTEVNDALLRRIIELSLAQMDSEGFSRPDVPFCWLALGSQGRGEQLLRTDQDSALVFGNVEEENLEKTRRYFLEAAGKAVLMLQQCGFEYCPAGMMASNPDWCLSLDEWKVQFTKWIIEPTPKAVMYCTVFFDYRPIYGHSILAEELTRHIFAEIDKQTVFLSFLAKNALENPPPLTFFRSFMVEAGGEHKDEFDIKARAMMPLADAARTLILEAKVEKINNTFRRFEKLAELEPQNRDIFEQAADAYEVLMRYRALQGLKQRDSGRYFNPSELSKMERLNLRNSFRPIKDIQAMLNQRFQLQQF
jgi:CBS domain-containing protein